jgi:hypothetical protein
MLWDAILIIKNMKIDRKEESKFYEQESGNINE